MDKSIIASEFSFKAVRSSGAGGQNVNKVSSKVVLSFDLLNSKGLTDDEKTLLRTKIATKLTQDGILILTSEEDRSQLKNKEKVIKKCFKLLENALIIPKERKATKVTRAAKEKRLNAKKVMSVLKQNRKKTNF
ncbi:alternative ribosome rescue aminoacyl-tRNA hydrolase ArfB [Flavobacterium tibetense]|uniref:Aminoacyl-tRNA hydrolase n=1 Tax=Flavobacterium tibetense TaxID=2233533 RepID=A0A365P688_9FLAO|nr:alternative ribosome rescue aminoacyl-tRNA hydrolase ArfB [Flavobacterium tibetense]RBA29946.1 aminoacyl-tRNA hydrolase [Flavobacterium tibetense]